MLGASSYTGNVEAAVICLNQFSLPDSIDSSVQEVTVWSAVEAARIKEKLELAETVIQLAVKIIYIQESDHVIEWPKSL